jgi:hypothetical protein
VEPYCYFPPICLHGPNKDKLTLTVTLPTCIDLLTAKTTRATNSQLVNTNSVCLAIYNCSRQPLIAPSVHLRSGYNGTFFRVNSSSSQVADVTSRWVWWGEENLVCHRLAKWVKVRITAPRCDGIIFV